jgi:hypothetical protein
MVVLSAHQLNISFRRRGLLVMPPLRPWPVAARLVLRQLSARWRVDHAKATHPLLAGVIYRDRA